MLQVWAKNGELVFERKLDEPITNWSISTNKFMFQESNQPNKIFILILVNEGSPKMYDISLPDDKGTNYEYGSINAIQDFVTKKSLTKSGKSRNFVDLFKT